MVWGQRASRRGHPNLKAATEADHRAVENVVPLMHDALDLGQYLRCLQRMHGVVAAWEDCAFEVAPLWMRPALAERQRRALLDLDLAWFGTATQDASRPALPQMNDLPGLLGTMYVMEGSTLGGQSIASHVERTLHFSEGHGSAFFRGYGAQTGQMWKDFGELLKIHIIEDQTYMVVASAKAMFLTYGEWMREKSAVDGS